ncbi:hypothetical protein WH47_02407 [Habropoda laboriosa]|uniref:Uncharacterized protein n=1 Tax=Habropoda laboriosa TaxID=597456 RepID=A0A0L7QZC8_9HYME|nr:hypothetical protein WH47_02407 [Habropoda laboriosa]
MQVMQIQCGINAHHWINKEDIRRLSLAKHASLKSSKEGRMSRKGKKKDNQENSTSKKEEFFWSRH